jgi:hypothetical protein
VGEGIGVEVDVQEKDKKMDRGGVVVKGRGYGLRVRAWVRVVVWCRDRDRGKHG